MVAVIRRTDLHNSVTSSLISNRVVWHVTLDDMVSLLGQLSLDLFRLEVLWNLDG